MPNVISRGEVIVTISDKEAREAIEHAAWTAALNEEPGLAVTGNGRVTSCNGGYQVTFTRKE